MNNGKHRKKRKEKIENGVFYSQEDINLI